MVTRAENFGALYSGEGTWQREARRLLLLAAELDIELDGEALLLCDVRDLQALRLRLREALGHVSRHAWSDVSGLGLLRPPQPEAATMVMKVARLLTRGLRRYVA